MGKEAHEYAEAERQPERKPDGPVKAPELKENPDTVLSRRVYTALHQKLVEALQFARDCHQDPEKSLKEFGDHIFQTLIKDEKDKNLIFTQKPEFIFPFNVRRSLNPDFQDSCFNVTFDSNGCKVVPKLQLSFMSFWVSDEEKAKKSAQEKRPDRKPEILKDLLDKQAKKGRDQFVAQEKDKSFISRGGGGDFAKMVNDWVSDCYSGFTVSERAFIKGHQFEVSGMIGKDRWGVKVNFSSNNYSLCLS